MKRIHHRQLFLLLIFIGLTSDLYSQSEDARVLVFTKTTGYRHATIPDGMRAIQKLGEEHQFAVDTTSDSRFFNKKGLKKYDAVIFMSTSGVVFNKKQKKSFERYLRAGGGYLGIHAASTTEYDWPWYKQLVGAYFDKHPEVQQAELRVHPDDRFPFLNTFPNPWKRTDEWYNFRELPENVEVLVSIDEKSYEGGTHGADHPLVWYHDFDGGRAFYLGLGHTPESYRDPLFLKLLLNGIYYAMGE